MASVVGNHWREMGKRITGSAVCLALFLGLLGCSQQSSPISMADNAMKGVLTQKTNIEEVSSPIEIQQLRRSLSSQSPQVKIVGLKPDATIEQTTASIRFEVDDFPIFKDSELELGPHLTVLLDDQPYADVYDAKQSITFTDLKAGTHRVQVFASTPWNESLKTPGAFDQLSFNVFAPTLANRAAVDQPRLIYGQPQGEYGAEPILLDYILTPPLAQTQPDMKVQVTVNGNSFVTEEQPPIYLKGFKSGTNWVKVEVLASNGGAIAHPSEIIQLVTLKTGGTDTLSKLTRGDLEAKDAEQIISLAASQRRATQKREALSAPIPTPTPTPTPQPTEKKVEDTEEVLLPDKSAVKPIPEKASVSPPAVIAAPQPVKQNVPIVPQKPVVVELKPITKDSPSIKIPEKSLTKTAGEKVAPIQSFLNRFRPTSPAVSLQPKAIAPGSSPEPSIRPGAASDKTAAPFTPIPTKTPDAVAVPVGEPTAIPIPEKTAIEKAADGETFPAIAWKKFLKFKAGGDRTPSALRNPANQKSLPTPQVNTTEPKPEPSEVSISTPASNSEATTSKT